MYLHRRFYPKAIAQYAFMIYGSISLQRHNTARRRYSLYFYSYFVFLLLLSMNYTSFSISRD